MYKSLLLATHLQQEQLARLIGQLNVDTYTQPQPLLGGSSLGQHIRHIIEFYQCLWRAMEEIGPVCYDGRRRDLQLEQQPEAARISLALWSRWPTDRMSLPTFLHLNPLSSEQAEPAAIPTTYGREWAYVYEHALHHMALLKVPVLAGALQLHLPPDFGIAPSTLRHIRQQQNPA